MADDSPLLPSWVCPEFLGICAREWPDCFFSCSVGCLVVERMPKCL